MRLLSVGVCLALITLSGLAMAQDDVMFNYQGRVKVGGTAFTGTGGFKFAILNTSATAVLWTNDGTGITGGAAPTAAVNLNVEDGVFNVMVGDPAAGMTPINSSIFQSRTPLKLRTWFNDGTKGFQELHPDQNLANISLVTLTSGARDFVIYVNGATGNDANNGLTADTAKKTIQGAINILPPVIRCNVTVDIADGVYRESANAVGVKVQWGKNITFLGDESWTPASASDPAVRITGADVDTPTKVTVRANGFMATDCSGISLRGLLFDYYSGVGAFIAGGNNHRIRYCKATDCNWGFSTGYQADVALDYCVATRNITHGFAGGRFAYVRLTGCVGTNNGNSGFYQDCGGAAQFLETCNFSNNGFAGVHLWSNCYAHFAPNMTGRITGNPYSVAAYYNSFVEFAGNISSTKIVLSGPYATSKGGVVYQ